MREGTHLELIVVSGGSHSYTHTEEEEEDDDVVGNTAESFPPVPPLYIATTNRSKYTIPSHVWVYKIQTKHIKFYNRAWFSSNNAAQESINTHNIKPSVKTRLEFCNKALSEAIKLWS